MLNKFIYLKLTAEGGSGLIKNLEKIVKMLDAELKLLMGQQYENMSMKVTIKVRLLDLIKKIVIYFFDNLIKIIK